MSLTSRRGTCAALIARLRSIGGGSSSEVTRDERGDLVTQPDAVVRAPVLRINLGGVGQVEAREPRPVVWNARAVVEGNNRLRRSLAKHPCLLDPRPMELGVDPLQKRDVGIDQG